MVEVFAFNKEKNMEQIFNEIWKIYPRKDKKQVSYLKFKKMFLKINSFAKQNNITVYKVFENWLWSEFNKKQILDNSGEIILEKKQFIPYFVTMLNQERWEDEPFTNIYGKEVKGYFDVDTKKWLRVQKKIEPVVLNPERIQSLADYKKSVPQSALKYHKKNVAENNNMAEKSKAWLERKGVAV
tara:strand:+ start:6728 stop:7279 length:552 start_codon:yes stop_codon:yes gene_type:complete